MTKNVAFQTVLDALLDDSQPFPPRFLYLFSDIEPGNLNLVLETWPQVSLARQHALLEDLKELVEDNTLLSFDDFARALLKDADPQVRVRALHLLWDCGDTRLAPTFLEILNEDSDFNVRAAAATALGMFVYLGEVEEISPHLQRKVEDNLLTVLRSSDQSAEHSLSLVRRRALEALGSSSRPEVAGLIEAAYGEKEADWKVSALFAMGRSGDEGWGKHVLSNLRNQNEAIRMEAIHAAGELALASARPVLLDMLADEEDLETQHEIIWELTKIGGEEVRDRLELLLEMVEDDEEAEFIEEALENLAFTEEISGFDLFDSEED
ncbi:MAG: HEAT repeat domain-containing protein [Anaerolineales bacterium]|nr:HEAT repeat domain-containing protein [Anaerolineales bacterium]